LHKFLFHTNRQHLTLFVRTFALRLFWERSDKVPDNGTGKLVRDASVARDRDLVITNIVALAGVPARVSKTSAPAVPVTGAVSSTQDRPIHLTEPDAGQASFAEGERVLVNGQYKLRQNPKVTVTSPAPVVAKQGQAS
jgi:hypothetical protein